MLLWPRVVAAQVTCIGDQCPSGQGPYSTVTSLQVSGPIIGGNVGIAPLASVKAATAAALPNNPTYSSSPSGVGATLLATVNGALVVDGYTVAQGNRILVKNQPLAYQNGLYVVSATGGASAPYRLDLATDAQSGTQLFHGISTYTAGGTTNSGASFLLITNGTISIGTTPITWVQFTTAYNTSGGNPVTTGDVNLLPNPLNNPGGDVANQIAYGPFGAPISISGSTSSGLHEAEAAAALVGAPLHVEGWGVTNNGSNVGTQPQLISIHPPYTSITRGIYYDTFEGTTLSTGGGALDSRPGITLDSGEIGDWMGWGLQVGYSGTGPAIQIFPQNQTPNDHVVTWSLGEFRVNTIACNSCSADLLFNLDTQNNTGVLQSKFTVFEVNAGTTGTYGIEVKTPATSLSGFQPAFYHNISDYYAIHGFTNSGISVGQSTTNQQYLFGNIWHAFIQPGAATNGIDTYENHSEFHVGSGPNAAPNNLTYLMHLESGACKNTVFLLDVAGATTAVKDENGIGTGCGNIVIGNGAITVDGKTFGVGTGTSLALGGATIGGNALAVTGAAQFNNMATFATNIVASTGVTFGGVNIPTLTNGIGYIGSQGTTGLLLTGKGSTSDFDLRNSANADVMTVATGTINTTFLGAVGAGGAPLGPYIFTAHPATNQNFTATGPSALPNGVLLSSVDDANATFKGMEFKAGLFQFTSSSGTATHISTGQTTAPALTSCGTSPVIVGTDTAGEVTMGTGNPTGCVITFNVAYTTKPSSCVVQWEATPLASQSYSWTNTAITLVQTATSSNKAAYICMGASGG